MGANTIHGDSPLEAAMTAPTNVHRLADGTINFDFYRHAAARQRRRMQRRALRAAVGAMTGLFHKARALHLGAPLRPALPK